MLYLKDNKEKIKYKKGRLLKQPFLIIKYIESNLIGFVKALQKVHLLGMRKTIEEHTPKGA
ncbi:hypothetical protein CN545_30370 [Bacillus toyonensis]|nr:hypothetical protein CN545_30370 [Bacillus toyonensis]